MGRQIKFKKNIILKRVIFLVLLVTTFFAIFSFSEQNGIESGSLSKEITEFMVNIISKIKTMDVNIKLRYIEILHPIIRKLAHFGIYTVVGFSIMGFMSTFDIRNIFKFITSLGVGITYAITDEVHQYFVPGRGASILDVGIDSLGVITGIFTLIILMILLESIVDWLKK